MTDEPPAGPRPLGSTRTATALTERTGWPVRTRHIPALAEAGHLDVAGYYEGRPLYDRDQAAAVPEAVVAALPGMPQNPPGPKIKAFAAELGQRYGLEVEVVYRPRSGRWHLDWPVRPDGHPDPAGLRKELAVHAAGSHRRLVDMATPAHRAIAAARRALAPEAAAILDTETSGLGADAVIVEVAIVDAATGEVLLDSLVDPDGVRVEPAAAAVHGITDAELATAPTWPQVWPRVAEIARERTLVAYNADFDRRLIQQTCRHHGLARPRWDWACAMAWRGAATRTSRPGPLGGGHRALADARAARHVVRTVAGTTYVPEMS